MGNQCSLSCIRTDFHVVLELAKLQPTMSFLELEKYLSILEDKNLVDHFYASRRKKSLRTLLASFPT
jgi:hypothetical protein